MCCEGIKHTFSVFKTTFSVCENTFCVCEGIHIFSVVKTKFSESTFSVFGAPERWLIHLNPDILYWLLYHRETNSALQTFYINLQFIFYIFIQLFLLFTNMHDIFILLFILYKYTYIILLCSCSYFIQAYYFLYKIIHT